MRIWPTGLLWWKLPAAQTRVLVHAHTSKDTLHAQYIPNPQLGTIWCAVHGKKSDVFTFPGWEKSHVLRELWVESECSTNHISQINLVMFGLVRWGFTQHYNLLCCLRMWCNIRSLRYSWVVCVGGKDSGVGGHDVRTYGQTVSSLWLSISDHYKLRWTWWQQLSSAPVKPCLLLTNWWLPNETDPRPVCACSACFPIVSQKEPTELLLKVCSRVHVFTCWSKETCTNAHATLRHILLSVPRPHFVSFPAF